MNYPANPASLKSEVRLIGILLDDSPSMSEDGKDKAVIQGLKDLRVALSSLARYEVHVLITGFSRVYAKGSLESLPDTLINPGEYNPSNGHNTPLFGSTLQFGTKLLEYVAAQRAAGETRPVVGGLLLMSDGMPTDADEVPVTGVNTCVGNLKRERFKVCAMNIGADDSNRKVFEDMGISSGNIFEPTSDERAIRHAFDMFSRSMAAVG
jgi:uncharacterized protein YegL